MTTGGARFVRRENVKHFKELLDRTTDPAERQRIEKLLAEEQQKQAAAGDFDFDSEKEAG
jgi:hypothetical protein